MTIFRPVVIADDGFYRTDLSPGAVTNNGAMLVQESAGAPHASYVRFPNFPKGVIASAILSVVRDAVNSGNPPVTITGNAVDDAVTPVDSDDGNAKVDTAANFVWTAAQAATGVRDILADVAPILNEIVSRPGFTDGNAIMLMFRNRVPPVSAGVKNFRAIITGGNDPAELDVELAVGGSGLYPRDGLSTRPHF